jgi:hypothetical protein
MASMVRAARASTVISCFGGSLALRQRHRGNRSRSSGHRRGRIVDLTTGDHGDDFAASLFREKG